MVPNSGCAFSGLNIGSMGIVQPGNPGGDAVLQVEDLVEAPVQLTRHGLGVNKWGQTRLAPLDPGLRRGHELHCVAAAYWRTAPSLIATRFSSSASVAGMPSSSRCPIA